MVTDCALIERVNDLSEDTERFIDSGGFSHAGGIVAS